ncbi:MAG: hypothetical protein ACREFJ_20755 [Acetobacteraceae bacterium]
MFLWIESHHTSVIAIILFVFWYGFAAIILFVVGMVEEKIARTHLKPTTPSMLTPLSLVAGLLIVFLASRVWTNLDHANTYVANEASALREGVMLADSLPPAVRTDVKNRITDYLAFVDSRDWPAMARGKANLHDLPPDLPQAIAELLAFRPQTPGQQIAQKRAVVAIEQALAARRSRILLSEAAIGPIQWIAVFVLCALVLVTIAMIHVDTRVTSAINLFIFATAISVCLLILMVNDRPYAPGGNTVTPHALHELNSLG